MQSSDSNSASSCTSSTPGSPFVTGTSLISTTLAASCCTRLDSGYFGVGSNSISVSCSTTGQMISLSSPPLRNLSNSGGCMFNHSNPSHLSSPVSIHSYGTVNAGIVTNTQQQQQPHSPRHSGQCFNHFEFPSKYFRINSYLVYTFYRYLFLCSHYHVLSIIRISPAVKFNFRSIDDITRFDDRDINITFLHLLPVVEK